MENSNSAVRNNWNDISHEILLRIFLSVNVADLAVASLVCKSWKEACRDPSLWHKLDLSRLSSYCFNIPNKLRAWSDKDSSTKMIQFLKSILSLSNGNVTGLVFNFYVHLTDVQFITVAERTPNLKRLVLPMTGDLSEGAIKMAMKSWGGLQSISISSMVRDHSKFSAIVKYCKNITEMKFNCDFGEKHAEAMIKYTPKLKVLSIRSIIVSMNGLRRVLTFMEHLKAVNICHSLIMDKSGPGSEVVMYRTIRDLRKHLPPSCL